MLISSIKTLLKSTLAVSALMFTTYILPVDSFVSSFLIYAPITMIIIPELMFNINFFTASSILSVVHGLTHYNYRFLCVEQAVDRTVGGSTFDQFLHLLQAVLFLIISKNSGKNSKVIILLATTLVFGNIGCLVLANQCFHLESNCYDIFVKYSIFQSFASGLHFGIGAQGPVKDVNCFICLLQGFFSLLIRQSFIESNDIIKFFARTRFFESYFIVPHVVGYYFSENRSPHPKISPD